MKKLLFVLSFSVFILSVLGNTETYLISKELSPINVNTSDLIVNYFKDLASSVQLPEYSLIDDETLFYNSSNQDLELLVDFKPLINAKPFSDSQSQLIFIPTKHLETGYNYQVKVCWSAINPISITLDHIGQDLFVINVTTNYYSIDTVGTAKYLKNIKLKVHFLQNNQLFGLLSNELFTILVYVSAIVIGSLSVSKIICTSYFTSK